MAKKEKKQKKAKTMNADDVQKKLFGSLKGKIVLLIVAALMISNLAIMFITIPAVKSSMTSVVHNYMLDLTKSAGEIVDNEIGTPTLEHSEMMAGMLGDIKLEGVDSSYVYVVAADGTMLYHPTPDKIGQPVENAVVTGLVADLAAGKQVKPEVVEYEFKGAIKYAGYYVTADQSAIIVLTADESEVLAPVNKVVRRVFFAIIFILIASCLICYSIAGKLAAPITQLTGIINRLAELNFRESPLLETLSWRKDETGTMARSVRHLLERMRGVIEELKNQSTKLYKTSELMDSHAEETSTTVGHVETAVNEIAEGATSQAQETQRANDDVITMGNMIEATNHEVSTLQATAEQMRESSEEALKTLKELDSINRQAIESIDVIYRQTNTTNESALKIKEATILISSIAEETNLLSLNASIEAARAGEAGRGFAVVASQIQKLAEQSNSSAEQIDEIIHELIEDSAKAVETMGEVKQIMSQQSDNMRKTSEVFAVVQDGIGSSLAGVNQITSKTTKLDEARTSVVEVVQSLTAIAQQNAASTEETSASVIEVSNIMQEIAENAGQLKDVAQILEDSMNEFQL